MADWGDDEDFGGFESAAVGDNDAGFNPTDGADLVSDGSSSQSSVKLNVLSPKSDSGTSQIQILDWILSNTSKPQSEPDGIKSTSEESILSTSHGEQLKDHLKDSSEFAKNLDGEFSVSGDTLPLSSNKDENLPKSSEFMDTQKLGKGVTDEPKVEKAAEYNSSASHKLQAELDKALIMKEQTQKSLESLQKEMRLLQEESSKALEENKEKHKKEIDSMKKQHQDEISELQKISEETVTLLTKQYSETWKLFEREKSIEVETNASAVTDKCINLLQQQQVASLKHIEDSKIAQENELKEILKREKESIASDVENTMEKEKEAFQETMRTKLKERMTEEAKQLQEIHVSTLKEALSTQQAHFEDILQSTLKREREHFAKTLKLAVKDAQEITEKAAKETIKLEAKRTKNQTMAVKMLLTSALQQVEQNFFNESDNFDRTENDS
ncbi:uncharacterized protein LOC120348257 [Styela clava]